MSENFYFSVGLELVYSNVEVLDFHRYGCEMRKTKKLVALRNTCKIQR